MPSFHCPMGAAYYDGDGCILCGMCEAKTEAEMAKAAAKVRAYLQAQRAETGRLRKITVCGKGGVGKTTVSVLIAQVLVEMGYRVLVMDADESNPGLRRMLGFDQDPKPLMKVVNVADRLEQGSNDRWIPEDRFSVTDIPSECVLARGDLKFAVVGKIEDPLQGCACSLAEIAREVGEKLSLDDKEFLIVDAEAGVESFGRGVERSADAVLAVVEPTFDSIVLAERISFMASGLGVKTVRAVLNKIPSNDVACRVSKTLAERGVVECLGAIPFDRSVAEAGFEGRPPGESEAIQEMRRILKAWMADGS